MFSQWVTETREAKKLSKSECARRADVKFATWHDYETVDRPKDKATVEKIADALGAKRSEALSAAGYQSSKPDIPAELETIWQSVPRERQAGFLRAVRSMADAVSL